MIRGDLPDALIEEMQWPAGSSHSVVAVVLRDSESMPSFLSAFLKASKSQDIAQSVSVFHGSQFASYRVGRDIYKVGETSPLEPLARMLRAFPWLIAAMTLLICFLMAVLIQAWLRRHARTRLQAAD
jgi:cellulose synthase (UDP-forming)